MGDKRCNLEARETVPLFVCGGDRLSPGPAKTSLSRPWGTLSPEGARGWQPTRPSGAWGRGCYLYLYIKTPSLLVCPANED
ncbi:hypothetical protein GMSM_43900 [Geomonas sp. Red276]